MPVVRMRVAANAVQRRVRIGAPLIVAGLALTVAACTELPRDAPSSDVIRDSAAVRLDAPGERVPYALVRISPSTLRVVNDDKFMTSDEVALAQMPSRAGTAATVPISIGDILSITVFEAQAGGLFIPNDAGSRSGNFVSLPNQQVDAAGFITVPYAGNVHVAGLSPKQASDTIAGKLKSRAIEPQVVISTTERRGSEVSILGEVNQPSRFALDPGGLKLSGAIARGGGSKFPDYDTSFTLQRRGSTYRATLSSIFQNPKLDVQLQGNDLIYLAHNPRFVMVLGATLDPTLTSITRRVTFESAKMNLAEALAKAGGLNSSRADPSAVFIFRSEPKSTLTRLGLDTSQYSTSDVPTVYQVDLASADGVFMSDAFRLHNRDIVVVSDSPYADYVKFFALLNQVAVVPTSGASLGIAATRN